MALHRGEPPVVLALRHVRSNERAVQGVSHGRAERRWEDALHTHHPTVKGTAQLSRPTLRVAVTALRTVRRCEIALSIRALQWRLIVGNSDRIHTVVPTAAGATQLVPLTVHIIRAVIHTDRDLVGGYHWTRLESIAWTRAHRNTNSLA